MKPNYRTHAEEIYLQADTEAVDISQSLPDNYTDTFADLTKRMEPYGGYTTGGVMIGLEGVSDEDFSVYRNSITMQEHAQQVNELVKIGQKGGINAQLIADSIELQAKLSNLLWKPEGPDYDALLVECMYLADELEAANHAAGS